MYRKQALPNYCSSSMTACHNRAWPQVHRPDMDCYLLIAPTYHALIGIYGNLQIAGNAR